MFYISSKRDNNLLGITDSKDGVEEFYPVKEVKGIIKKCNLDVWGFTYKFDDLASFNESFIVDINKFLDIIKSCDILFKTQSKPVNKIPLSEVLSSGDSSIADNTKNIFNMYLKAFHSNMFFEDALKYLTLKIKWKSSGAMKFYGVRYYGFPEYEYIDVSRQSLIVKYTSGDTHKLYDIDKSFGSPYINEIAIQLTDSNFNICCHNLPYGESY